MYYNKHNYAIIIQVHFRRLYNKEIQTNQYKDIKNPKL